MANSGVRRVFGSQPFFISGSSSSSSSSFLGSSSMVSFEDVCWGGKRSSGRPFFCTYDQEENGDDDYDEFLHQPEKKRRMTIEQVQFLEKSFEMDIKLEPERKAQLAKELGLQPRQIAIWFQNRRARWKTKQMEKDFDALQASYNGLKSDYDSLVKEKEKLKDEVDNLTSKLQMKEQKPFNQSKTVHRETVVESNSESEERQHVSVFGYNKQEDLSSAKSDVVDSDSPHYVDRGAPCAFEADQSSHAFTEVKDVDQSANFELSGDEHAQLLWPYWDINLKIPNSLNM